MTRTVWRARWRLESAGESIYRIHDATCRGKPCAPTATGGACPGVGTVMAVYAGWAAVVPGYGLRAPTRRAALTGLDAALTATGEAA